ncbi:MAG: hypothetical protein E6J03_13800 [Chloroflexi bacterium]|nr:MAG: hypothetical protein E6J03_13800 [Chloroflexota bacterium]
MSTAIGWVRARPPDSMRSRWTFWELVGLPSGPSRPRRTSTSSSTPVFGVRNSLAVDCASVTRPPGLWRRSRTIPLTPPLSPSWRRARRLSPMFSSKAVIWR